MNFRSPVSLLAVAAAFFCFAAASSGSAAASKAPAGGRPAATTPPPFQGEIPQSVFTPPTNPRDGRNPFYPQSTMGFELPKPKVNAPPDFSNLVLNGITSPPKRTAMINGRTLEKGEQAEVRLPNGSKVDIKCEDIKTDSAVVLILNTGQRLELRLRSGV